MKPEIMRYIPIQERRHFMKCTDCGNYFDMRDLQQVHDHFHKSASIDANYSHSIRVGEPIAYTKNGKPIDMN